MDKDFEKDRVITDVECKRGYACIKLKLKESRKEVGEILKSLAEANVHFTIPKIHQNTLNFVLPQEELNIAIQELKEMGYEETRCLSGCSLVTVYAPDMRNLFGVMVQILEVMLKKGAEVLQVGDSYNSVSCLIKEEKLEEIIPSLGEVFPQATLKCNLR
ncbi:ACT domain-containing protein [bacterium]|nr:ACT domain-containing protein [bacterium]